MHMSAAGISEGGVCTANSHVHSFISENEVANAVINNTGSIPCQPG
jgi:hypothetical protein